MWGRSSLRRHTNCMRRFSILRVGLLLPTGFSVLSFAPIAVFETANSVSGERFYDIHLVSETGKIANSLGRTTDTVLMGEHSYDTLLLGAGAETGAEIVTPTPRTAAFLRDAAASTRRIVSICIAAFTLAEAGLLDGRRATTHWARAQELQRRFPKVRVEMDRIFIADGPVWTSAGMTAGIDLALGLIERDMGQDIARATARTMVVDHRRAGGQSQHSAMLELDAKSDRVQTALAYAKENLREPLSVEKLADAACLSPRQFARVFKAETGQSPAKAIENLRLEAARFMLEQGRLPVEEIAREAGFGDRERTRRSFLRTFGQTPQAIRNASHPLASI
jgi:transcriptional regulator GlxA family with amidase domain